MAPILPALGYKPLLFCRKRILTRVMVSCEKRCCIAQVMVWRVVLSIKGPQREGRAPCPSRSIDVGGS